VGAPHLIEYATTRFRRSLLVTDTREIARKGRLRFRERTRRARALIELTLDTRDFVLRDKSAHNVRETRSAMRVEFASERLDARFKATQLIRKASCTRLNRGNALCLRATLTLESRCLFTNDIGRALRFKRLLLRLLSSFTFDARDFIDGCRGGLCRFELRTRLVGFASECGRFAFESRELRAFFFERRLRFAKRALREFRALLRLRFRARQLQASLLEAMLFGRNFVTRDFGVLLRVFRRRKRSHNRGLLIFKRLHLACQTAQTIFEFVEEVERQLAAQEATARVEFLEALRLVGLAAHDAKASLGVCELFAR
jgi:hypothetical protein